MTPLLAMWQPLVAAQSRYELPVLVEVRDPAGELVFNARIAMWISASPSPGEPSPDA